jgi:NADPH2:quinone reductase
MKAIQIASHGGLEVLQSAILPDPAPKAGEVLVRVKASAINPLDGAVRMGKFPMAAKPPLILGEEASGVIARDGKGFKAGQKVIVYGGGLGVSRDGTWADLVAVPTTSVRELPEGISFEEGAALSHVGVAAYGALRHGGLEAGETLLVLGATGGVGSAAVQLGKALGASVIAVVSKPERASEIIGLGADHVVALSDGPFAEAVQKLTEGKGTNLVLDPLGGEFTGQAFSAVSKFGRLVHLGSGAGMTLTINSLHLVRNASTILGFNIFLQTPERLGKDYDEIVALAAAKKYRAFVGKTFPAAEVAEASRHLESGKGAGKVVLAF